MSAPIEVRRASEEENFCVDSESKTRKQDTLVTENGVTVLSTEGKTPSEKSKVYNERIQLIRELVLCALHVETLQREETLHCLDAVGGTGLTGLQWKKHLRGAVHVTVAEKDYFQEVTTNCDRNGLSYRPLPLDFCRVPGDPMEEQQEDGVHVCKCTANVLFHMEAFDFVYLNPHGGLASHIEAALTNHRNNGLLCIVATDSTHQFTRSAHTVRRHFDAVVTKTDYLKELAVRVIIATIVRAAARCNKGIDMLTSVCVDDYFLIIVRVLRGPKLADQCIDQLRHLLHCQMCEERAFCPKTLSPTEEPYKVLSCSCKQTMPGKTGVILGPLWSGNLFSVQFLAEVQRVAMETKYTDKLQTLLSKLLEEAKCEKCQGHKDKVTEKRDDLKSQEVEEPPAKRQKHCETVSSTEIMPAFYYNVHRRKLKGVNIPKYHKFLDLLWQEGYRASRTHFDHNGIRTSASWANILDVLTKHCQQGT